jgi:hypothetical protein
MKNSEEDVKKLTEFCNYLNICAKKFNITLKVVEIKGTVFYMPELPANKITDNNPAK